MSLRTRLTLAGGGAVFVALAVASLVIYVDVRSKLRDQIDFSLIQSAESVAVKWHSNATLAFSKDASGFFQVVPSLGDVTNAGLSATGAPVRTAAAATTAASSATLAPKAAEEQILGEDKAVATGVSRPYFRNVRFGGAAMRMYTMRLPSSKAGLVRTLRPLTEANATIARVRWLLLALTLGGALAAGLLGRLAANAVLRPVRALAGAVREVSATRDLNRRIPVSGRDELASLAADFNAMLATLDESQQAQQQLIADASHELRTPLTAHRANIELLARPDLPADRRQRVLGAAVRGIEELSALVGDLIQAARDGRSVDAREPLALDELAASAVERAQHRAPGLRFESRLEPHRLVGARSRLERAIDNVLDNAIKWTPLGGTVDIRLADGTLTVRDHGPGIAEADLPHVFDRFYRAAAARALPGSGLGLAIVKQTVDDHGGSVTVANADGGGALVTLRFDADGR
ncbi:MAG: HAMP domain-containing histidine kinase [Actinomycetota bacterium]|nr:HAMP domain-containing histidine kinase [Actinomycetota bacterium]